MLSILPSKKDTCALGVLIHFYGQSSSCFMPNSGREILYAVESYPVTVIVGETGSGKTTRAFLVVSLPAVRRRRFCVDVCFFRASLFQREGVVFVWMYFPPELPCSSVKVSFCVVCFVLTPLLCTFSVLRAVISSTFKFNVELLFSS